MKDPKRILLTGSSGFLGTWLRADLKEAGHTVFGIDQVSREGSPQELDAFFKRDLRADIFDLPDFDLCIHLASGAGGFLQNFRDQSLLESELEMLQQLQRLCKQVRCDRIIFTSSINVFEDSEILDEGSLSVNNQKTPYSKAKAACEKFIEKEFKDFSILRPTNFFGPDQPKPSDTFGESHVIPDLLRKIREQEVVEVFGDGEQIRNFIHISDVAKFIVKMVENDSLRYVNLRSDLFLSIQELTHQLMSFLTISKPIQFLPQYLVYEPRPVSRFSINAARELQWHCQIHSLVEGLDLSLSSPMPTIKSATEIQRLRFSNGLLADSVA